MAPKSSKLIFALCMALVPLLTPLVLISKFSYKATPAKNDWHRFFMIFFGVGVIVFYLVHLFMKEGKPEKPIGKLTKYASRLFAICYLVIGLLVHYLFIAVF